MTGRGARADPRQPGRSSRSGLVHRRDARCAGRAAGLGLGLTQRPNHQARPSRRLMREHPRRHAIHEPHKIKTVRLLSFPSRGERKKNLAEAHFNVFNLTPVAGHLRHVLARHQRGQPGAALRPVHRRRGLRRRAQLRDPRAGGRTTCSATPTSARPTTCSAASSWSWRPWSRPARWCPATPGPGSTSWSLRGIECRRRARPRGKVFTGNVDLARLEELLHQGKVALVGLQAFADGQHPFSLGQPACGPRARRPARRAARLSTARGSSRTPGTSSGTSPARQTARSPRSSSRSPRPATSSRSTAPRTPSATPAASSPPTIRTTTRSFMNEVVVYEGLHTYGGMAGRTMEVLARGLAEMCDEAEVHWVMHQTERFTAAAARGRRAARARLRRRLHRGATSSCRTSRSTRRTPSPPPSTRPPACAPSLTAGWAATTRAGADPAAGDDQRAARPGGRRHHQPVPAARADPAAAGQPQPASGATRWHTAGCSPTSSRFEFDTFPYEIHTIERIGELTPRASARRRSGPPATTPSCCAPPTSRSTC